MLNDFTYRTHPDKTAKYLLPFCLKKVSFYLCLGDYKNNIPYGFQSLLIYIFHLIVTTLYFFAVSHDKSYVTDKNTYTFSQ